MQITYYEEGERNARSMSLILHIDQSISEINRIINKQRGIMINTQNINVFKHSDEPMVSVVFPMNIITSTTEFGNVLYDLVRSEARGYTEAKE